MIDQQDYRVVGEELFKDVLALLERGEAFQALGTDKETRVLYFVRMALLQNQILLFNNVLTASGANKLNTLLDESERVLEILRHPETSACLYLLEGIRATLLVQYPALQLHWKPSFMMIMNNATRLYSQAWAYLRNEISSFEEWSGCPKIRKTDASRHFVLTLDLFLSVEYPPPISRLKPENIHRPLLARCRDALGKAYKKTNDSAIQGHMRPVMKRLGELLPA